MKPFKIAYCFSFFMILGETLLAQSPKVTHFVLDNGLQVYLSEDHNSTEVYGAVVVKAGSKYDPPDATGMAH